MFKYYSKLQLLTVLFTGVSALALVSSCRKDPEVTFINENYGLKYHIQYWYSDGNGYLRTNHYSDSLEELVTLASTDIFVGSKIRIADEEMKIYFENEFQERPEELGEIDMQQFLNTTVIDFSGRD